MHLPLQSPNIVTQNIQNIATLFPNCITETANGIAIDWDLLRQELSAEIIDGTKERYRLEWPGKREAIVTANLPTTKTLRPIKEDSVAYDTTQNLYIEGDNLEVLKLLQESYLSKVKMIYIDPPYNTGNDFVYKDNFAQGSEEWKAEQEKDTEGNRLFVNPETSGRYHSDWLSMMYPRLKLARNLLTDDGVTFISIDDNEVHNLRKVCDEIFGEGNFVSQLVWERAYAPINLKKHFSPNHDHILVYSKQLEFTQDFLLSRTDEANSRYSNPDNDIRGIYKADNLSVGPAIQANIYEIITPSGRKVMPPEGYSWRYSKFKFAEMVSDNRIWFGEKGNNVPAIKRFISEVKDGITPMTILKYKDVGHSQDARKETKDIFEGKAFFDYPKPVKLIYTLLDIASNTNDIILDFFSGSATTAHAVMQLNAEDGGNRKFIMVQVPEATDEKSEAYKAGYKNICEIGKERIRRAGAKIQQLAVGKNAAVGNELAFNELPTSNRQLPTDFGFKVFRLDSSNMQDVYYKPQDYTQQNIDLFASNIKPDRTPEDLLAQVMLSWGLPLHYQVEVLTIQSKQVFKVAQDSLYACFDAGIDEAFAKEIATHHPLRIVFNDASFASDTAKENVKQLLKQLSASTEMKVI